MRLWIRDCEEHHPLCHHLDPVARALPTRLIYLGNHTDLIRPTVRPTAGWPTEIRYTTLSHCWGGEVSLRLLRENEILFRENLPISELSQTFKDAMQVTRQLEITCIWIDSLCIVQDSEEDWQREAARMADVYRSSYCNIAATAAKNGQDGLFARRTLLDVEPCRVQPNWAHPRRTYMCSIKNLWDSEIDKQPLLARAWVTQELILAKRTLHFSRKQVFWECLKRRACETYPGKLGNTTAVKPALHPTSLDLDGPFSTHNDQLTLYELWDEVVAIYSKGDLTYKTEDKLVAVSGIARNLGLPAEDYLAGLWKQVLVPSLLWRSVGIDKAHSSNNAMSAGYRAPTWSWASIDGRVSTANIVMEDLKDNSVEVLETKTVPVNPSNPFGQLQSAFIRLRCMLARAYLSEQTAELTTRQEFRNQGQQLVEVQYAISDPSRFVKRQHLGEVGANVCWDRGELVVNQLHYCLLLLRHNGVRGLIVQPTGRQNGEYERLGRFSSGAANLLEMFREPLDSTSLYESMETDTETGMSKYIVTLV